MRKTNPYLPFIVFLMIAFLDGYLWFNILGLDKSGKPEIYFLDVGQGDGNLIILPATGGRSAKILIDGGPGDKLLNELSKILPLSDRYIDLVIMTHPQLDHFGGFIDLLKTYEVGAFIGNGRRGETLQYKELISEIKTRGIPYITLQEGNKISYGRVELDILSPSSKNILSPELNDTALVTMLSIGDFRALFMADADSEVERELADKYNLKSDILKVGHHGSKYSSDSSFLREVAAKFSVIEVGKNSYGHPTKEALARLAAVGTGILRTDQMGTLGLTIDGNLIRAFAIK